MLTVNFQTLFQANTQWLKHEGFALLLRFLVNNRLASCLVNIIAGDRQNN